MRHPIDNQMEKGIKFEAYSQRMVRDPRCKLVRNAVAETKLYDVETDPGELTNLVAEPQFKNELARLKGRLVSWMQETKDPMLNLFNRWQFETK